MVLNKLNNFNLGNKFTKKNQTLDEELDENKCPKYKLALLCGPPGLGKTTLAHLLARQAGKLFTLVICNIKLIFFNLLCFYIQVIM